SILWSPDNDNAASAENVNRAWLSFALARRRLGTGDCGAGCSSVRLPIRGLVAGDRGLRFSECHAKRDVRAQSPFLEAGADVAVDAADRAAKAYPDANRVKNIARAPVVGGDASVVEYRAAPDAREPMLVFDAAGGQVTGREHCSVAFIADTLVRVAAYRFS